MRVVSYGSSFLESAQLSGLTSGKLGFCNADGTVLDTSDASKSFIVLSTIPTKSGGYSVQRGVEINPFNFTYEVRKYDETDQRDTIVIKGLKNPTANAGEGVVYPADAEFCGSIEIVSSTPYRQGLVLNPYPQILTIPVRIKATDTIDMIVEKIKKGIFLTTMNKELFDVVVEKETDSVKITVTAKKDNRLRSNLFGIVCDQEAEGVVTVQHTKFSGFLNLVGDSEEDNRYSMINYGWNPHDEWQGKAWGLGDAKQGLDKVGYIVISTAEFNQFPEIAADNNCPRKIQIIVMPSAEIDKAVAVLKAIKTTVATGGDNAVSLNTTSESDKEE